MAPAQTAAATAAHLTKAANRAVDDPVQLARAARIVRAALARQRLSHADLDGDVVQPLPAVLPRMDSDPRPAA
jgi:hypothetical protein